MVRLTRGSIRRTGWHDAWTGPPPGRGRPRLQILYLLGSRADATPTGHRRVLRRSTGRRRGRGRPGVRRPRWCSAPCGEIAELDALIEQHSQNWRLERLAVVDRLILRMAVWELRHEPDTPPAVVHQRSDRAGAPFSADEAVRVRQRRARRRFAHDDWPEDGRARRRALMSTDASCPTKRNRSRSGRRSSTNCRARRAAYPTTFDRTHDDRRRSSTPYGARRRRRRSRRERPDGARRRPHPRHPQLRQGELPRALRRPARAAGRTCAQTRSTSASFQIFKLLDFGDQVGVDGRVFRTKTNELTIWASRLEFLAKCLLPLPGEMARADRRRDALPAALSRSDRQSRSRGACSRRARGSSPRSAASSTRAAFSKSRRR